jgi:transposase-like protein
MDCKYCDSSDVDFYFEDEQPCYRCNDCGESWESLGEYLETE